MSRSEFDLLRTKGDPLLADVLDSAADDAPRPGAKAQMFADLGLDAAPPSLPPSPSPALSSARWWHGVAIAVAGASTIVALHRSGPAHHEPDVSATPPASVAASSPPPGGDDEAAVREPPPVEPEPELGEHVAPPSPEADAPAANALAVTGAKPRAPVPASAAQRTSSKPAPQGSTLGLEIARVSEARRALAAGEHDASLRALDAYDADFPRGAFSLEVAVLRIEALAKAGRAAEARARASTFLAEHPTGAFARRVNASLGSIAPPDSALTPPRD